MKNTIEQFAARVQEEQRAVYLERWPEAPETILTDSCNTTIKPGRKYTKVDVGTSGKFMVDEDGQIWGIKSCGKIHHGHFYGTLDTINEWNWGEYAPVKKPV